MISRDDRRITPDHLRRAALIYPRQSTPRQVREHPESTRIQLNLRERAIALGWPNPIVIKEDLGISAAGFAERPGFQDALSRITKRQAGIVFCWEASRLSRNSKDWAHLFELCGYFDVLVADEDQIYDIRQPNDRLVLGIKGTVAEVEERILSMRLIGAIQEKAERGALRLPLPAGYEYDSDGKIAFDPDRRVQRAIRQLFERFDKFTSVRQLAIWYVDTSTLFPMRKHVGEAGVRWVRPNSRALVRALVHPIYAGAYVHGRHVTRVEFVDGRLVKRKHVIKEPEEWKVLIRDNHRAYISWERLLANRAKIAENRPRWPTDQNRGAIRAGKALLAGMLRCGQCGRRVYVIYSDRDRAIYHCHRGDETGGHIRCMSFGSRSIDRAVSEELRRALSPLAIDAARAAEEIRREQKGKNLQEARLQVEAAQYEADRALEQFDRCDPKNRLVADTLEERLNVKLSQVADAKRKIEELQRSECSLTPQQIERLEQFALDFPRVWDSIDVDPKTRKSILRAAIREIIVKDDRENRRLEVTIHWQGGVHTRIHVPRRTGWRDPVSTSLLQRVQRLAKTLSDTEIARILNMDGVPTPAGLRWSAPRVKSFRNSHAILAPRRDGSAEYFSMKQARVYLGISHNALLALVRRGAISTNQVERLAPWRVSRQELDSERIQGMVRVLKTNGRLPQEWCPEGQLTLFNDET